MKSSIGKARFQQPYDFFFAALAVVVSTLPIVDTVRFIPQKTVDKSFGPLGFDEGYKSPDSEIVWGGVHVLATRELGAFPTPLQTFSDATVSLIAHFTSGTQAGCILAEITFCPQMTHAAHQTAIRDTVYKSLFVHWWGGLSLTEAAAIAKHRSQIGIRVGTRLHSYELERLTNRSG